MTPSATIALHFDRTSLIIFLAIGIAVAVVGAWKRMLLARMRLWPLISAKIETVFVAVYGKYGELSNSVLAYSYTIDDSYYSGEIRLGVSGDAMETVEKELVGHQVFVHYDSRKPEKSIFLEDAVEGWEVIPDSRISVLSWLDRAR